METYNVKVLPFFKEIEIEKNGKTYVKTVENFTEEEQKNMSAKPVIYWEAGNEAWLAERPLYINISGDFKKKVFYAYNELTDEEKEKYQDRTIEITLTRENVTKVYKTKSKTRSKKRR